MKVSESEKEKKRLESLLIKKKDMGVQCTNTGEGVPFNPPPSPEVSSPLFNEIDDNIVSLDWEPLNSLMASLAPITTTSTATKFQYLDDIDLITSRYWYQSGEYQGYQQLPQQSHSLSDKNAKIGLVDKEGKYLSIFN